MNRIQVIMRMSGKLIVCLFFAVAINAFAQATASFSRPTIALDSNWRFALQDGSDEWQQPQFDDSSWETVSLPHTWNGFDGQDGGTKYYRGIGWYRTHFKIPSQMVGQRVLVEFDGASKIADLFVNGKSVGKHVGAFARFRFDITDLVSKDADNVLAVRVSNATEDIIPIGGDFTQAGGLYRRARLLFTNPAHIETLDHASPGVFLVQKEASAEQAKVVARIEFKNDGDKTFKGRIHVRIQSPDGTVAASADDELNVDAGNKAKNSVPLTIEKPHLWNGVDDPFVYQTVVEITDENRVVDSVTQPLGLRTYVVKPDSGFFLNGRHVHLHGVNRHQDSLDKGWAISEETQKNDFAILQELGVTVVRLCHYQHDQSFYSLCDQGGVAVWAELCFVGGPPKTEEGRANAKEQLRELVRQNYNHPSILFWSMGNETSGSNSMANSLLVELAAIVHEEDPTRLSVYASCHGDSDPRNFDTDILGYNKYFGWYGGALSGFAQWADKFHTNHPSTCLGISEYGAGASVYQHEENPTTRSGQAGSRWHPEEYQAKFHEEYWLAIKERPYIWGTFVWVFADFASDGRKEGDHAGINDKGLVTRDRLTRKDAFYWYQANWSQKPVAHIVSKRFNDRTFSEAEIRAYSNGDEVEAFLNGISLGRKTSTDCRFIWPKIELQRGVNRIGITSYKDGKPAATDWTCWNYRAPEDPLPNASALEKTDAKK